MKQGGTLQGSVSQTLLLADPLWLRKITTEPHILTGIYFVRMMGIPNRKFTSENVSYNKTN